MPLLLLLVLLLIPGVTIADAPKVTPLYEPAMVLRTSNFRADPSTAQEPLATFKAGKQVLITGETKDDRDRTWYAVSLYDGTRGFIYGKLLAPLPDFPDVPAGLGATDVQDAAAALQLVGSHGVILEWIGKQPWGELIVFEDLGLYYLTGSQTGEGKAAKDTLSIIGFVTRIDDKGFTLQGTIEYHLYQFDNPVHCKREGTHRFRRVPNSNTWQASGTAKPCGDWQDSVEVYLRKEG